MTLPLPEAIENGSITPAKNLRISDSEKEDYKEGIIFEKIPELLTRGHVLNKERISKIEERARHSNYVVSPIKYGFKMSFRILVNVLKFILKCRKNKPFTGSKLSLPLNKIPTVLVADKFKLNPNLQFQSQELLDTEMMRFEESCVKLAITYLYRTATEEAREFVKADTLVKLSVESDGILYCKNRLLESMEFKVVSGMEMIDLDPLCINVRTPIIERFSPLAYAFAQYIHYEVSNHAGLETCNRLSLERVFILQGLSLYKEISDECIKCKIKRRKFLEMSMGPIGPHNLSIAPPFYACQCDLYGPVSVYAPGAQKDLRGRPAKMSKVWSLVFVCPVTRLVNCQVIEKSDHSGIVDGVTRLAAEVGFPKFFMVDQDSSVMKALKEMSVNMRDLQHNLFTEYGVSFTTCPVGGHNMHGHVERVIRSIQHLLDDCDIRNKKLHATGYQTILKLVENLYNSLPIGYSYDKSVSNSPLLKIITPNFFKMGRNNNRALEGPVSVPNGTEMIKKISETYQGIFKLWADVYVPKLIFSPKWHKSDENLDIGDLVYMKRCPDNKLDSSWVMGIVDQVIRGRDGKVRRAVIKYQNASEFPTPQFTDRAVRQLVKIYDIEEYVLQDDLKELLRRLEDGRSGVGVADQSFVTVNLSNSSQENLSNFSLGPPPVVGSSLSAVHSNPHLNLFLLDDCLVNLPHPDNSISHGLAESFCLANSASGSLSFQEFADTDSEFSQFLDVWM